MKSYLLDTSAYSQMLRGHAEVAKIVRSADEIYLSLITVAELKYGFKYGTKYLENSALLMRFLGSAKVHMLLPDLHTSGIFAEIGAKMKKTGKILAHHDLWLVAQAFQNNLTLVTFDTDFTLFKDRQFKLKFLK